MCATASLRLYSLSAILLALALPLRADDITGERAVEAGRDALRDSADYPWYDPEEDSLRDLEAKAAEGDDTETRKTGWQWEIQNRNRPTTNTRPWGGFPTLATILQYTALGLLIALLIGLVVLLIRYFLKQDDEATVARTAETSAEQRAAEIDRVEQLPFQVRRPDTDLLSEARRLYEAGRFGEAIVYLFSYELVQLDKHQHIQLSKGKTNRQYLREIRRVPTLQEVLHRTMIAFEDVFFGHHPLERRRFEDCWRQLDQFHQSLEQGAMA